MNLNDFKQLCQDKNVLLVGNSVELMNYEYANLIDSYDIVIRFGKGIAANDKEKQAIGKKLDVWVTGDFRGRMILKDPYKSMLINVPILYIRSRIHMNKPHKKLQQLKHSLDIYTDSEIIELYNKYGIKAGDVEARRFSAGLWTIKFFCEKVKTQKSLTLIGFDFFAKSTTKRRGGNSDPCSWHRPIGLGIRETHWHEQEIKIVNEFKNQGLLNWIILSNLIPEVITDTKFGTF